MLQRELMHVLHQLAEIVAQGNRSSKLGWGAVVAICYSLGPAYASGLLAYTRFESCALSL
jgi:hypothetical protein